VTLLRVFSHLCETLFVWPLQKPDVDGSIIDRPAVQNSQTKSKWSLNTFVA